MWNPSLRTSIPFLTLCNSIKTMVFSCLLDAIFDLPGLPCCVESGDWLAMERPANRINRHVNPPGIRTFHVRRVHPILATPDKYSCTSSALGAYSQTVQVARARKNHEVIKSGKFNLVSLILERNYFCLFHRIHRMFIHDKAHIWLGTCVRFGAYSFPQVSHIKCTCIKDKPI